MHSASRGMRAMDSLRNPPVPVQVHQSHGPLEIRCPVDMEGRTTFFHVGLFSLVGVAAQDHVGGLGEQRKR